MARSIADWDRIVDHRASALVRIHLAGRFPIKDARKRKELARKRDAAFDRLVSAVTSRDRAIDRAYLPRRPRTRKAA